MLLKDVIEALIFASQKPLSVKEMVAALRAAIDDSDSQEAIALSKIKEPDIAPILEQLQFEFTQHNRAFHLVEQVSGWAFVTKPHYGLWVRQLYPESKPARLSGPALETLAIVAYRQPITKADIEAVRGVSVDGVMSSLQDRGLIRIAGRAEIPGRPLLYETTQAFMEHFGLRKIDELPNNHELRRVPLPSAADEKAKAEQLQPPVTEAEPPAAEKEAPAIPDPPAAPSPESASSESTPSELPEPESPIFEFFAPSEEAPSEETPAP